MSYIRNALLINISIITLQVDCTCLQLYMCVWPGDSEDLSKLLDELCRIVYVFYIMYIYFLFQELNEIAFHFKDKEKPSSLVCNVAKCLHVCQKHKIINHELNIIK